MEHSDQCIVRGQKSQLLLLLLLYPNMGMGIKEKHLSAASIINIDWDPVGDPRTVATASDTMGKGRGLI